MQPLSHLGNGADQQKAHTARPYCCGTSEASEQQHNQDLREKYRLRKTRFDRFLPEFTAPRTHLEPEFTAPRTIASLSFKPRFHFILRK